MALGAISPREFAEYCVHSVLPAFRAKMDSVYQNVSKIVVQRKPVVDGSQVSNTESAVHNVVSSVDTELQRTIADIILHRFPNIGFVGEEDPEEVFKNDPDLLQRITNNKESRYRVVVDPLDGTSRMLAGDARHSFLAQLIYDQSLLASVGYMPQQDRLIYSFGGPGNQGTIGEGETYIGSLSDPRHFVFNSTIEDAVALNTTAFGGRRSTFPSLKFKEKLVKEKLGFLCPQHTGSMYQLLFDQQVACIISVNTYVHDQALVHAVVKAGGCGLIYDKKKNQFVTMDKYDWRTATDYRNTRVEALVAARDEKQTHRFADLLKPYLKR